MLEPRAPRGLTQGIGCRRPLVSSSVTTKQGIFAHLPPFALPTLNTTRMPARISSLLAMCGILAFGTLAACKSESSVAPGTAVDPITNPLGLLNLGDVVSLNVNGVDACSNPVYHASRVVAVGTRAIILSDTLNPKNGFSTADFQRYAARFDSLVYPLDVANFGDPTDIDKNGRIAILFSRAVNELTTRGSPQYVGGFAFSRDLFPNVGNARAQACAASNQGEYFYALTPDPTGSINGNVRSTGFVDSVTTAVLAHELSHIINASRRLYVNNANDFEEKWLDEGLAHIAEELLYYRESALQPRTNIDLNLSRLTTTARTAYNLDMSGNASRYRSYLLASAASSPYALDDSLATRGAAWSLLRYAVDRLNATDGFTAGTGQVVTGTGSIVLTPGTTNGEYSATIANVSTTSGGSSSYTLGTVAAAGNAAIPLASPAVDALMRMPDATAANGPVLDVGFESRLRDRERSELRPRMAAARAWFAAQPRDGAMLMSSSARLASTSSLAETDAAIWMKLTNSTTRGMANLTATFGDMPSIVRDWSVSHAIDDVAAPATQYQQRSWNWHSIFPGLSGNLPYPLVIPTISASASNAGSVVAGGAAYYRIIVPANGSMTVSLGAPTGATNSNLQLVLVRTK